MISKINTKSVRRTLYNSVSQAHFPDYFSDRMMHLKIEILLFLDILKENTHPFNIFSLEFYCPQTRDKCSVILRLLYMFHLIYHFFSSKFQYIETFSLKQI